LSAFGDEQEQASNENKLFNFWMTWISTSSMAQIGKAEVILIDVNINLCCGMVGLSLSFESPVSLIFTPVTNLLHCE